MTVTSGAKFSSIYGMFGGYGCGTYPLAMVKGVNVYDVIRKDSSKFDLSIEKVMNEQPFEGGKYSTSHMGLQFDVAKDGELYMIAQGAGGGYGDPLERDPEAVIADAELGRIQRQGRTGHLRRWSTTRRRSVSTRRPPRPRRAGSARTRLQRGKPYQEFVEECVNPEPPADLLYYGSWGDDTDKLTATLLQGSTGLSESKATIDEHADHHGPRPPGGQDRRARGADPRARGQARGKCHP